MNRKHLLTSLLLSTQLIPFTLPTWAQNQQDALITGTRAGKQMGDAAFLLRLVATPSAPLRIALLPPQSLKPKGSDSTIPAGLRESLLNELSRLYPEWNWQNAELGALNSASPVPDSTPVPMPSSSTVSESVQSNRTTQQSQPSPSPRQPILDSESMGTQSGLVHNLEVIQLADQIGVDLALSLRIQPVSQGVWVLATLYSGADGSVLMNRKLNLARLEANELAAALHKELSELTQTPPVNDIEATGSELHLRSTPDQLHAYLDDVPVGLTPLILRGLPPGEHQLRLFEIEPYQVERIRIVSEPPGVMVKVNQRELGRTPVDFPAELMVPGRFEVELQTEGRDRYEAEIQVQTNPANIPVRLDNLPVQRTPVTFQELANRSYVLHLLPQRAVDMLLPFNLPATGIQTADIDAYKYAKLIVNTNVSNVELMLDDELAGETPFSANLPQGRHVISLNKNRYRSFEQELELIAGKTHELKVELRPRSADTSIFLTPTGELTPQFNIAAKYLGFGNLVRDESSELGHLYGLEVDYGWPELFKFANTFDIGLEVSAYFFALQTASLWRNFQGIGGKMQFLRESDSIPISAALGAYTNIDPARPKLVGYLSLSRNFGDLALHLGIQTHGFNINVGYTGWENVRIGLLLYADSFLRLLSEPGESTTTFYGLQAGYSF